MNMTGIAALATSLVALLHICFLVLGNVFVEPPGWEESLPPDPEFASATRVMAANQGLYNGFLAAGLLWGVSLGERGTSIELFFLGCVVVAGVFGAVTSSKRSCSYRGCPVPSPSRWSCCRRVHRAKVVAANCPARAMTSLA